MEYSAFVPHEKLDTVIGRRASAYRERVVDNRCIPAPIYGILERRNGNYVLEREKDFIKLEDGEGVFLS